MAFVTSCAIFGQNPSPVTYTVKGVLIDSLTLESEPYATIKIARKNAPAKAVKMAVTNNSGKFEEKISGSGDYIMTITSIGKTAVVREFTLKPEQKTMDLGTLHTADAANELQGVEVVAQKPLVKVDIDKIEYNIEDDPDSKTNSVLEMLRKVPLVTVDGEDNIQVNGSSSFKVHVNGKPNNMMSDNPTEVLRSMPAHTIKHIEVITNPGAKYDAEGIGGILNIVTVGGGFEGYTATFTARAGNSWAGGGLYATVKKEKLTVTGRYNYSYNNQPRSYANSVRENVEAQTFLKTDENYKHKGNFQNGSLEASYELDTLRLITMSFGMYGGDNDSDVLMDTWMQDAADNRIYSYRRLSTDDYGWYSIRGNIDYQRSFKKKGRLLTFSYNISSRPQDSDTYLNYIIDESSDPVWLAFLQLDNQRSDGEQSTTEHTFQGDYTTPIGKYHTIESGLKYIIRDNVSDNDRYIEDASGNYVLDNARSSHYKHLNDILAAYGGYSIRYKSFSGKAGMRYERTMQDIKYRNEPEKNFDTDFNDVVPSATLGFKIGQTKNIRAGYNMRIRRPSIYYLNPYYDDTNPSNVSQGNPNLESEKSHSLNLSYSSFTAKFNLNLSLNHSFNNNGIERVTELRTTENAGEEYLYNTYDNIGRSRQSGLSGYANWNASPKTRIYMNARSNYSVFKSPAQDLKNEGWNAFAYGGVQHTFPWDLRVSLNLMGSTPRITLQGRGMSFYDYNMSVNRSFMDKRLTVSAYAGNMFKKYQSSNNRTEGAGFIMETSQRYSRQRFGVNVSYRIGELKASVKKASRTISNDDEKNGNGGESGGEGGGN